MHKHLNEKAHAPESKTRKEVNREQFWDSKDNQSHSNKTPITYS